MKVRETDEMYRKEKWETHRKLVHGSSKCHATDVKQQSIKGRHLHKYAYGENVQSHPHYHYVIILRDNATNTIKANFHIHVKLNTVITK
jgi:hypothetical protein